MTFALTSTQRVSLSSALRGKRMISSDACQTDRAEGRRSTRPPCRSPLQNGMREGNDLHHLPCTPTPLFLLLPPQLLSIGIPTAHTRPLSLPPPRKEQRAYTVIATQIMFPHSVFFTFPPRRS